MTTSEEIALEMKRQEPAVPLSDWLDKWVLRTGYVISWVYAALIVIIIAQIAMRYGFGGGLPVFEELQWHLYAVGVMFGVAYAQANDSHIRVDLLHMRLSRNAQRIWEIIGILFLVYPFIAVVFFNGIDFFYDSWRINERSDAPVGLPWRWAIKAVIPLSFGLLFIAITSRLIRDTVLLFRRGV
jgi:TRAP-type mannitol/chloroaromatic compound transport system permease small subunit